MEAFVDMGDCDLFSFWHWGLVRGRRFEIV